MLNIIIESWKDYYINPGFIIIIDLKKINFIIFNIYYIHFYCH